MKKNKTFYERPLQPEQYGAFWFLHEINNKLDFFYLFPDFN